MEANVVLRSPTAKEKGNLIKFDFEHAQQQWGPIYGPYYYCTCSSSLLRMCDRIFAVNMGLDSVECSWRWGNLTLRPKQKKAVQSTFFNGQDCWIFLPISYGKSLTYKMPSSLFDKITARDISLKEKSIVIVFFSFKSLNWWPNKLEIHES